MKRTLLVSSAVATTVAVGLAGTAFAADGDGGMGHMGRWGNRGLAHPIFALVCLALLVAAVGTVVWLLVRRRPAAPVAPMGQMPMAPSPTAGAEAILAERLARSELSPDDYRAMLAALREPLGTPSKTPPQPPASS
jgi:uncharacterized membrane protein